MCTSCYMPESTTIIKLQNIFISPEIPLCPFEVNFFHTTLTSHNDAISITIDYELAGVTTFIWFFFWVWMDTFLGQFSCTSGIFNLGQHSLNQHIKMQTVIPKNAFKLLIVYFFYFEVSDFYSPTKDIV